MSSHLQPFVFVRPQSVDESFSTAMVPSLCEHLHIGVAMLQQLLC